MPKYEIKTPWTTEDEYKHTDDNGHVVHVVHEVTDLLELPLNHVWRGGAHRVRVVKWDVLGRPRTKTFKGESAWSAAERMFRDIVSNYEFKQRMTRW